MTSKIVYDHLCMTILTCFKYNIMHICLRLFWTLEFITLCISVCGYFGLWSLQHYAYLFAVILDFGVYNIMHIYLRLFWTLELIVNTFVHVCRVGVLYISYPDFCILRGLLRNAHLLLTVYWLTYVSNCSPWYGTIGCGNITYFLYYGVHLSERDIRQ